MDLIKADRNSKEFLEIEMPPRWEPWQVFVILWGAIEDSLNWDSAEAEDPEEPEEWTAADEERAEAWAASLATSAVAPNPEAAALAEDEEEDVCPPPLNPASFQASTQPPAEAEEEDVPPPPIGYQANPSAAAEEEESVARNPEDKFDRDATRWATELEEVN